MTRKLRGKTDPFEREIEVALNPGAFIPEHACFPFVTDLEGIADRILGLIPGDPTRAVTLFETFLSACYEKANEVNDSSGSFGQFVAGLFCGWIKARQAAGAGPDDTAKRLLAWMDDDPYAFCYELEKYAARAFDKAGLVAFEKQVRGRFDAVATETPASGMSTGGNPDYERRRWGGTLRTILLARKDIKAYVALAEEAGITPTIFAALLDHGKGGQFRLSPVLPGARQKQLYLPDSNVLLTRFLSGDGVAEISDWAHQRRLPAGSFSLRGRRVEAVRLHAG